MCLDDARTFPAIAGTAQYLEILFRVGSAHTDRDQMVVL